MLSLANFCTHRHQILFLYLYHLNINTSDFNYNPLSFITQQKPMWPSFYQVVGWNTPIFYPLQTAHFFPLSFPVVQTVSTIPTQTNIQSNDNQPESIHRCLENDSSEPVVKEQLDFTGQLPPNSHKELMKIMELVLSKIHSDPKSLQEEIFQQFALAKTVGKQFFTTLISKLKKLSKTKEEIIKYCMRKAFKFVNERVKEEMLKLPADDILREFIKGMNSGNQNIPFKKNSHFKTMNAHFLSQLFRSPVFVELYQQFLQIFPKICEADNNKKVEHLSKMMLTHIKSKSKDLKRFNNFKRIPWTQNILSRCYQIAQDLQKYASGNVKWGNSFTDQ